MHPTVMVVLLIVIGSATVGVPVVATVLVSVASRHEDSAWTLGGPPPSLVQAAARRIVAFHGQDTEWPQPQGLGQARQRERMPGCQEGRSPSQDDKSTRLLPTSR
jgi:hypothetical protein